MRRYLPWLGSLGGSLLALLVFAGAALASDGDLITVDAEATTTVGTDAGIAEVGTDTEISITRSGGRAADAAVTLNLGGRGATGGPTVIADVGAAADAELRADATLAVEGGTIAFQPADGAGADLAGSVAAGPAVARQARAALDVGARDDAAAAVASAEVDVDPGARASLTAVALIDLGDGEEVRGGDAAAALDAEASLEGPGDVDAGVAAAVVLRTAVVLLAGHEPVMADALADATGRLTGPADVTADAHVCLSVFGFGCGAGAPTAGDGGGEGIQAVGEATTELAGPPGAMARTAICASINRRGCSHAGEGAGTGGVSPGTGRGDLGNEGAGGVSPGAGRQTARSPGDDGEPSRSSGDGAPTRPTAARPAGAAGSEILPDTAVGAGTSDRLALVGSDRLGRLLATLVGAWLLGLALAGLRREPR